MNQRKIRAVINRLRSLPRGLDLFYYVTNMVSLIIAKKFRLLKFPYPDTVMLEVTNLCQLKCSTCAREQSLGDEMDKGNMSLENAKGFIDRNHKYLNRIALTGLGEPLLYPHIEELSKYIKEKNSGIQIFLSTNAQLPNTIELIEKIAPYLTTLQLSLDGVGDTYEEVRHEASFEQLERSLRGVVKLSQEYSFSIAGNMVVYSTNYKSMSEVIELCGELGIGELNLNTLNQVSFTKHIMDSSFYDDKSFIDYFESAQKRAKELNIELTFEKLKSDHGFKDCPYSWGHTTVTWDGFLVPCCAKPFPKVLNYGNVFEQDFRECMNSSESIRFRSLAKKNIAPEFCKGCHYVS